MKNDLVVRQRREQKKQVDAAIRDHGRTTPMKLEEKRLRLSQTEQLVGAQIAQIQIHKHTLQKEGKLTPDHGLHLDMMVLDLHWKAGVINGLGSIVDCLTMRTSVNKKGKKGYARFSLAWYNMIDQRFDEMAKIVEYLRKISGSPPEEEGDEDDDSIEDEEIVPEERGK